MVFLVLFFPEDMDRAIGAALSFAILLTGHIARPIGGTLFGHLSDKYGRKNSQFITLLMMGTASVCIGLMPAYHSIGIAALLILVFLRIIQGLAVGSVWLGATLLAAEQAKEKTRGRGIDQGIGRTGLRRAAP